MSSHRVRFQLQQGSRDVVPATEHEGYSPCTKREAKDKLDVLSSRGQDDRKDSQWKQEVRNAISAAKDWIDRASGVSRQGGNANVFRKEFTYDGYTYRVDIEIWAGDGHFA